MTRGMSFGVRGRGGAALAVVVAATGEAGAAQAAAAAAGSRAAEETEMASVSWARAVGGDGDKKAGAETEEEGRGGGQKGVRERGNGEVPLVTPSQAPFRNPSLALPASRRLSHHSPRSDAIARRSASTSRPPPGARQKRKPQEAPWRRAAPASRASAARTAVRSLRPPPRPPAPSAWRW